MLNGIAVSRVTIVCITVAAVAARTSVVVATVTFCVRFFVIALWLPLLGSTVAFLLRVAWSSFPSVVVALIASVVFLARFVKAREVVLFRQVNVLLHGLFPLFFQ